MTSAGLIKIDTKGEKNNIGKTYKEITDAVKAAKQCLTAKTNYNKTQLTE